jgi:hypothetical protein
MWIIWFIKVALQLHRNKKRIGNYLEKNVNLSKYAHNYVYVNIYRYIHVSIYRYILSIKKQQKF